MRSIRSLAALLGTALLSTAPAWAQCGERFDLQPVPDFGGGDFGQAVAATESRIVVGGGSVLYVYSSATSIQLATFFIGPEFSQMSVAASGSYMVVGQPSCPVGPTVFDSYGKTVVFDLDTFSMLGELPPHSPTQLYFEHGQAVAVFGSFAVTSRAEGSAGFVEVYSLVLQFQHLASLQGGAEFGKRLALNAQYLAIKEQNFVRLYSVPSLASIGSVPATSSDAVALLGDHLFIGISSLDEVRVHNVVTGQLIQTLSPSYPVASNAHFGQALAVHGSDIASGTLAVGSRGVVTVFDTATLTESARYVAGSAVGAPSPSDHGRWVALNSNWLLAGASGEAVLFDLNAPCELTTFCYGDGTSGSPCLCGNESVSGAREGCRNSTGVGARLRAVGSTAIVDDDMQFVVDQGPAGQPGVFVQGETTQALPFFDGILCMGNPTRRMSFAFFDGQGSLASQGSIPSQGGGLLPGSTRHYQLWYRDPGGSPCGTSANLTNGVRIDWK